MATRKEIARQLAEWFRKWGASDSQLGDDLINAFCTGTRPRRSEAEVRRNATLADFRLRSWPARAARELEVLLRDIGLDPRPGDLKAREHNSKLCPEVPAVQLIDLLTMIHDLRTFGPRPTFRPEQTFEAVMKFIREFSRKKQ